MEWNGETFTYIVTVGNNQWEAFQILKNGSWDTVVYPSVKDANPQVTYALRGPDNHNKGYNWLMGRAGFNPLKKDLIPPGTKYKVTLHVSRTGVPENVNWELFQTSGVAAPELETLARDMPEASYHIAGSWADFEPSPMAWDGDCFSYMVRVGTNGWESFHFVVDGSVEQAIYPSVKDSHPYTHFEFKGPDNKNKGYNWVIGQPSGFLKREVLSPGTRCKVKLFVTQQGVPKRIAWDLYTGTRADRPTLICLAGLASGSLEVTQGSQTYVGWCRVKELVKNPKKVLHSLALKLVDGRLKDGTHVTTTTSAEEGVEVRPVRGIQGIKSLSPPGSITIPVWGPLVDHLEGDFTWHAFNYDWRRWGDEKFAEETVDRFRREVEEAIRMDDHPSKKANLIGHSMGTTVIMYILSVIGDAWVKKNIDQVILVAPAHMGSPAMVSSYAHCPFVDTQSWIPVPGIFDQTLGDLTATWACMISEMPTYVGGVAPWPEDHAFVITPEKEYRLKDIGQFLIDLSATKSHRETGPALWPSVSKLQSKVRPPLVPTTIIYGGGIDTPVQVVYEDCNLGNAPKLNQQVPGDGTIVASSVEAVSAAWAKKGAKVRMIKEPSSEGTSHKGLICAPFTASIIPAIIGHKKLTPIQVTVVGASGLRNADSGFTGLSDPYCRFHIPGKPATKRQTEVVMNNLSPEWHCTETIYAYGDGDTLLFHVFDMDLGCTDGDLLGRVQMTAQQVQEGFDGDLTFEDEAPGTLRVKVSALPPM